MGEKVPENANLGLNPGSPLSAIESINGEAVPKQMSATRAFTRIFFYGTPTVWCLQAIALIAACGSGVALALVNLVLGNFITLLSGFSSGQDVPADFMSLVSKQSYA
ncbi:hypothetical protein VTO58DRAFT_106452 [Aureobasidium pullulans]|nr:hypothetical protein D6D03_10003 [Aureobasidium pullulans]